MNSNEGEPWNTHPDGRVSASQWDLRTTFTWGLLVFAALLPIALLGLYSFQVTARAVRELVQTDNQTAARITAELVSHDIEFSVSLAESFAALPDLVEGVERRDEQAVRRQLRALVRSYARVDRAYVTDPEGRLWADFPHAPESQGRNLADLDWYRGLSRTWTPYVSEVYQRNAEPKPLVVAIAVPIRHEQRVIGALVYQCRLDEITAWLKPINLGHAGYVFVIDHTGTLAAHPHLNLRTRAYEDYARLAPISRAMRGGPRTAEYLDPLARRTMIASFAPVRLGAHDWLAVAQQPIEDAYAPIQRLGLHISVAAGILSLVALAVVITLGRISGRNRRLFRELEMRAAELRIAERRSRQLIEESLDPIIVADQQGNISLFNPAAQKTFGYTAQEVLGHSLTMLMPPEFHNAHERGLQRYVETRESRLVGHTVAVNGLRKNGEIFPLELSLSVLGLPDRILFLGAIRDLTERYRMQARVDQSEKLASLSLLSAGMAHEVNNPLAYVANNLAVIERDTNNLVRLLAAYEQALPALKSASCKLAEEIDQLAEEIDLDYLKENLPAILKSTRQGVKRIADIVQSLRNFARLDRGSSDHINLLEAIQTSLEMIQGRLNRRNITVELPRGDLPTVICAPVQVNQVLLNLLVNAMQAIEASTRGSGRIEVHVWKAGNEVVVEIADDGPGIPADVLPRIFDPFFTTKAVGEGTGLGLSISHGIVTDHGGRIEVDSTPGLGSRFRVILPVAGKGTLDDNAAQTLPVGGR
ncbi:MAG: ATP-binding protein [Isosphaeraceae bacterium]